jgi:O-antigen/teichoic acid export membrane protein
MIDQHKTLAEKFLKKWFWLYLFSFIIAPIWYIIKIIISEELTVSEVGILYGIISLITLLWAFNDFWMTESLNKFIPQYIVKKDYSKIKTILTYSILTQLFTWVILAWFFFFWADYIANNFFQNELAIQTLKIFSLFFIWINIFQVITTFFMAIQNTFLTKVIELFRMWFILLFVLLIYLLDLSNLVNFSYTWVLWLYIWIIVATYIFYKKYYLNYFKNIELIWSKDLYWEIFKYAIWVFLWAQAATILWQIDMQMIIYILWTTDAWYYTNYLSIIWIPFMIIWPIFSFLFPIFSEMHAKWDIEKIKLVKSIFQKNFLAIWIAFNILFFIFSEIIAYTLFWNKFIESWVILKYSILLLTFNFLLQINFNIMAWIWKVKDRVKIISIALIFNFIMNIILIKLIWVYWAALATWLWWVLIWFLSELYIKNYYVKFNILFLLKNITLMWIIWLLINIYFLDIFEWISRIKSLYYLFVASIIYFWIFLIINYSEFRNFILEIKKIKKW